MIGLLLPKGEFRMEWKTWVAIGLVLQVISFVPSAWNTLYPEPIKHEGEGFVYEVVEEASKRDTIVSLLGFALVGLGAIFQITGLLKSP